MSEYRSVLERAASNFAPLDLPLERVERGRDRRGRNRRITAGVVGIAVFVAAIWVVTSGLTFDQSTPAVPGSETGPAQTGPPPALASGAPDVVRQRTCSDGARSRLELTELGQFFVPTGIQVRFEVHRSPVGHSWRITLVAERPPLNGPDVVRRISVASDSGDLAVQVRRDGVFELVRAKAVDAQTGQVCRVDAQT